MKLTNYEQDVLNGKYGEGAAMAMEIQVIDDKLSSVEYDANETANDVIIHMLIGEKVSEIVKFVANKYDVTYDTAKKDILEFHRILRINGLL